MHRRPWKNRERNGLERSGSSRDDHAHNAICPRIDDIDAPVFLHVPEVRSEVIAGDNRTRQLIDLNVRVAGAEIISDAVGSGALATAGELLP